MVWVCGLPRRHLRSRSGVGERAAGVHVRDEHDASRVQDLCRLRHKVHTAKDDHIGVGVSSRLGQLQRVPDEVGEILNVRILVVVGENHRIALNLECLDFVEDVSVLCHTTAYPGASAVSEPMLRLCRGLLLSRQVGYPVSMKLVWLVPLLVGCFAHRGLRIPGPTGGVGSERVAYVPPEVMEPEHLEPPVAGPAWAERLPRSRAFSTRRS